MPKRLAVIGLDCVTPQLFFDAWLDEMPNVKRLVGDSIHGHMVSTIPPITVPAWMAMMTSQDPGQMGIYGFRNRKSYDYENVFTVNATYVTPKTVWNHLSRNRLRSIVMGVPLTYPPKPLNGMMVSSFLTPDKSVDYTYPPELKQSLDELAGGEYIIDVRDFRNERKQETLDQIYAMTHARFRAFRGLLAREEWDFAMMVEMGPDRLHHAFWRYHDPTHRLYEADSPFRTAIHDYYVAMDEEIGRTVDSLPADTSVILISDHGAKKMTGGICINEFFLREGLLSLRETPTEPTRLKTSMIDWSGTRAWGEGGYYARVFLNVEGREPQGQIPRGELEAFRADLKAKIEALGDENGNPIGTKVFFPEEVYRECRGTPPDMIVYLGNLDWRSAGTVGGGSIHIFENDTGPDDANHAQEGVFVWHGRGRGAPPTAEQRISIYDVAPSILDFFSIGVPEEMIGQVI